MNNNDHNKDNHEGADRELVIAGEDLPSTSKFNK